MIEIQLPVLEENEAQVRDAFAAMINDRKSALLFRRGNDDWRLVPFENLEEAYADGVIRLGDVPSKPVPRITGNNDNDRKTSLRRIESGFGFFQRQEGKGVLAFLSDEVAQWYNRYNLPSTGFRCNRPDKPSNINDNRWYHYYPPNRRDPNNPQRCRVCGAPLL
jgi:hypothetical protein